jgi:transcriptional regulator with XRE-family HTH domain
MATNENGLADLRRTSQHKTAQALGRSIGVSGTAIRNWETGNGRPTSERITALARALGVAPGQIEAALGPPREAGAEAPRESAKRGRGRPPGSTTRVTPRTTKRITTAIPKAVVKPRSRAAAVAKPAVKRSTAARRIAPRPAREMAQTAITAASSPVSRGMSDTAATRSAIIEPNQIERLIAVLERVAVAIEQGGVRGTDKARRRKH